MVTGDALPKPIVPLVLLALALTSYFLRPESRKLQSPRVASAATPRAAVAAAS